MNIYVDREAYKAPEFVVIDLDSENTILMASVSNGTAEDMEESTGSWG